MSRIGRHWRIILGTLSSLCGLWPGVKWLLTQAEHVVFLVEIYHWAESVMDNIPPWTGLIALPIGLLLIWWDLKRPQAQESKSGNQSEPQIVDKPPSFPDQSARANVDPLLQNQLVDFCLDYLLPACDAQLDYQRAVVMTSAELPAAQLILRGLQTWESNEEFYKAYSTLHSGLTSTAGAVIDFESMVDCIEILERTYRNCFCSTGEYMRRARPDLSTDHNIRTHWELWLGKHNALVKEYEKIKRDSRIPKLFRPGKESRWGGELGAEDAAQAGISLRL